MTNIWWTKISTMKSMELSFSHYWKRYLVSLDVHLISFTNLHFSTSKFFHWFIGVSNLFKKIQIAIFFNYWSTQSISNYVTRCKWSWHFISMRCKNLLSYFSPISKHFSWPIQDYTRWRLLNLRSSIKDKMLWTFFTH